MIPINRKCVNTIIDGGVCAVILSTTLIRLAMRYHGCNFHEVFSLGVAFGWGLGSNLQLSTGEEDDEYLPIQMSGKNLEERNVLDVAAGSQHTVLLASLKDTDET